MINNASALNNSFKRFAVFSVSIGCGECFTAISENLCFQHNKCKAVVLLVEVIDVIFLLEDVLLLFYYFCVELNLGYCQ